MAKVQPCFERGLERLRPCRAEDKEIRGEASAKLRGGGGAAPQLINVDRSAHNPDPPNETYVGSAACQTCHPSQYKQWHQSLHVQMTKPIAQARIEGDFSPGAHLEAYGRSYRMERSGGRYTVSVSTNGGPAATYQVDYTLGAKRFQGYLSKLADGRIYVLPVFWMGSAGRWIDWTEIAPVSHHYTGDLRQIWNVNCVNCHGVNIVPNYDVASRTYKTTWTEMGIGCEDCHGPGSAHVQLMTSGDHGSPASSAADLKIFSPATARPRQVLDTCGYCHGNKTNYFIGFTPGRLMEDFAEPFLVSQPIPSNDPQGEFWPDGRPSRFNRPQAVMDSQCFLKGGATCISCHIAHGSPFDHSLKVNIDVPGHPGEHSRASDQLCVQCHKTMTEAPRAGAAAVAMNLTTDAGIEAHTHHPAASQGSRCITCHMADVNWRLFTRRLDHTFQPPVPEMTANFGEPNTCTACHDDKTPEWAEAALDRWYGHGTRRAAIVKVAEAMYRAGAGDPGALEDIAAVAVDRKQGPIMRASAADFAGRLIWAIRNGQSAADAPTSGNAQTQTSFGGARAAGPEHAPAGLQPEAGGPAPTGVVPRWVVNALVGAAADPEPVVRIAATRALGYTGDPRVIPALVALLSDTARVVRATAAKSLLELNVTHLDGDHGAALVRAQADYAATLQIFRDVPDDHVSLGWLDEQTGRRADAVQELNEALALDPRNGRAHIYLGVIAARDGRYTDAIKEWQRAEALGKATAGIDRLITEARKRGGH
jgi:hypothetical protein